MLHYFIRCIVDYYYHVQVKSYTKSWCTCTFILLLIDQPVQTLFLPMDSEDVWALEFRVYFSAEAAFLVSKVSLLALAVWAQVTILTQKIHLLLYFLIIFWPYLRFSLLLLLLLRRLLRRRRLWCRCCSVRHGVCEVVRGAPPAHVRAPGSGARTLARKRAETIRRQLLGTLRWVDEPEEHDRQIGRLPHRLRHVEGTGREMLHVDGRFSSIWSYQGAKPIP